MILYLVINSESCKVEAIFTQNWAAYAFCTGGTNYVKKIEVNDFSDLG